MLKSHFKIVFDSEEPVEEEEVVDVVQEEEVIVNRILQNSEVSVRLSMLGKNAEGDGYVYQKCKITGLNLTSVEVIKSFEHIMFLDLSHNLLDLKALQTVTQLPFLILIQADFNRLNSAALNPMRYLQVIIMNNNQITSTHDIFQEQMSTIELGYNKIEKVTFGAAMPTLKVLDFRYNLITEIADFNFPILDSLYLEGNNIRSLVGLEKCVNLRILHVRNNPIRFLNGFDIGLRKLQYINLRNCKVESLKQIKKLRVLEGLQTLVIKGCPFMGGMGQEDADDKEPAEDDPQLRIEVLAALPRLKRLNKDQFTPEERDEAKTLMMEWIEEGEKEEEEEVEEEIRMEEQSQQNEEQ